MTDNRKTTVPGASVGADAVQSSSKINTNIITNSGKQINLQAAKKSNNFGLNTVSMTELYDTVYPPRKPIVNDLLYSGTYLFVGAPKVGKSFFMGQLAYHVAMGLPLWEYEVHQGTVLYLALEDDYVAQLALFRVGGTADRQHLGSTFIQRHRAGGVVGAAGAQDEHRLARKLHAVGFAQVGKAQIVFQKKVTSLHVPFLSQHTKLLIALFLHFPSPVMGPALKGNG